MTARNAEALESFEDQETTDRSLIVRRAEEMARLPRISVELDDAKIVPEVVQDGQVVRTAAPRLAILAKLSQAKDVDSVLVSFARDFGVRKREQIVDLGGDDDDRHFHHEIGRLDPGKTQVWVTATTSSGATAESYFVIDYQPSLPRFEITEPASGNDIWFQSDESRTVSVEGALLLPEDIELREDILQSLKATLFVGDEPVSESPSVDPDTGEIRAKVPVEVGGNQIKLVLELGNAQDSEDVFLTCFEALEGEVSVPEKVSQAIGLLGIPETVEPVRVEHAGTGKRLPWRRNTGGVDINLEDVPLEGFVARVHFDRLPSVDFRIDPIEIPKPTEPPRIVFTSPAGDGQLLGTAGSIEFSVQCSSRLNQVTVQHTSKFGRRETAVDVEPQAERNDEFVLSHVFQTPLDPGMNTFTVFAESEGGRVSAPLNVTRVLPPVIVHIDRIESEGTIVRNSSVFGTPSFTEPASSAKAMMHGYLELSEDADQKWRTTGRHFVHTWINGFQQLPVPLEPLKSKDETRLRFEIPVLLSGSDNLVQLSVPGLPRESRQQAFHVGCQQPLRDQRLHLLLIGASADASRDELLDNALETLQLKQFGIAGAEFSSNRWVRYETRPNDDGQRHVFREVFLYRPLTGNLVKNRIVGSQLFLIHKQIAQLHSSRGKDQKANDVVVVYYAGSEQVRNDGHFHLTTGVQNQLLSGDTFSRFVSNTQGAHLLLLDVNRSSLAGGPLPMTEGISVLRLAKPESHTMLTSLLANASPPPSDLREFDSQLRQSVQSVPGFPRTIQYDGMVPTGMEGLRLVPE